MKEEYEDYEFPLGCEPIIELDWIYTINGIRKRYLQYFLTQIQILEYQFFVSKWIKNFMEGKI